MKLTFLIVGFAALTLAATTSTDLRENVHRFSQLSEPTAPSDVTVQTTGGVATATAATADSKPNNESTPCSPTKKIKGVVKR